MEDPGQSVPPKPAPPPILYAPAPPARSGRGWKYLALILLLLLVLGSLSSLQRFVSGALDLDLAGDGPGSQLNEVVVESHGATDKIAIVEVQGVIYGGYLSAGGLNMVSHVREALDRAAKDERVRAVVLRIDSPGGEVLAADDMSRAIAAFQEDSGKPVVAAMEGLAASGGYYIAAPCRWILANPLTITGSIGVIMHGYNYRGLMDKIGVRPEVFKSGRFKDAMRSDKADDEILPEERAMMQELIDTTFDRFKDVVRKGRQRAAEKNRGVGRELVEQWEDFADGRVLLGEKAFELGFVDELGTFEDAVARAKSLAGILQANLIRYEAPLRLGGLLRLLGKAPAGEVKLDLGLRLPRIEAGRPYALYLPAN
ncbi:MAG: signal peptide peptidase SppA [Verrucomicrobiales bacterium]|nr:signal peptide peptidase SppA [Verrucomicrobiales bacterium]